MKKNILIQKTYYEPFINEVSVDLNTPLWFKKLMMVKCWLCPMPVILKQPSLGPDYYNMSCEGL